VCGFEKRLRVSEDLLQSFEGPSGFDEGMASIYGISLRLDVLH
jgi:hypothetical protein